MGKVVMFGLSALAGVLAVMAADSSARAAAIKSIPGLEGRGATAADDPCWLPEGIGKFLSSTCTGDRFMNIPLDVRSDNGVSTTKTVTWFGRIAQGQLLCVKPVSYFGNGGVSSSPAEQCGSGPKTQSLTIPTNGTAALSVRGNLQGVPFTTTGIWSTSSTE